MNNTIGVIFNSSIGKKLIMSVTGIAMALFLVGHLLGNVLLYVSKESFNAYADFLAGTKLTIVAEVGLVLALVLHVYSAARLSAENKKARSRNYAYKVSTGRSTWSSSHMLHSGLFTLVFIIVHLWTFKFGDWSNEPGSTFTLYDLVVYSFSDGIYALGYVIAMLLLGLHLHHAIKSAFQTLGVYTPNNSDILAKGSAAFAVFIAGGFATFPIYFYIQSVLSSLFP